jgi:hypothetical protein
MRLRAPVVVAAVLAVSAASLAQGPRRDGRWEVKTEMDMPGIPPGMPPLTSITCVTKAQANDPQKFAPGDRGRGGDSPCKTSDFNVDGNKVTWTMKCEGDRPMTAVGEMIYGDGTYTGTTKIDMDGRGTMTMKYTAKRLGDCEEK